MRQATPDALASDVVAWLCPAFGVPRDMPAHVCRSLQFLGEWGAQLDAAVRRELFPPFAARLAGTRVMAGRTDDCDSLRARTDAIIHGLVTLVLPVWFRATGHDAIADWLAAYPWPFPAFLDPALLPTAPAGAVGDLFIERLSGWDAAWRLYRGPFIGTECRAAAWFAWCVDQLDTDTTALARANALAQLALLRVACDAVAGPPENRP